MKKFSYEENGYNRSEVNTFIDEMMKEAEYAVSKIKQEQEENAKLQQELAHYREMKEIMKNAIIRAEESSNKIKKMALDESEILIREAKENASRIVNDALIRANQTETERIKVEKNIKSFKKKLRAIMQENMQIVDEIEKIELDD